jgi:hypothetical protein
MDRPFYRRQLPVRALVPRDQSRALRRRAGRHRHQDRSRAEDALEAIDVTYRPLPATVDPPPEHDVVSDRHFRYGHPEAAFATATHRIASTADYPRNGCTPIECFVVVAQGGRSPPPRSVAVDRSIDLDGAHGVGAGRRRQRRQVVGPVYAAAECSGQPAWCGRAMAGI